MKHVFFFLCFVQTCFVYSQNTLDYNDTYTNTKGSLNEISWISGYWKGEALGGTVEEIWSEPLGGSMMFSFKLVIDNSVKFYELGSISEIDNSLVFKLKHFDANLHGWESKEETVDFKFIKIEGNRAYFDQFTFEKISDTEMNIYVVVYNKGKKQELVFNYHKQ